MKSKRRTVNSAKLSRTHAPAGVSPSDWQRGLRRQFGREQSFGLENIGAEPFFAEFRVSNPVSKSSYRVAIQGREPGDNFCCCPDYATSELGTCKHIEFTLARLEKKRGAKTAFARGYQPAFSELYLRNEGRRSLHFRAGTDCPPALREAAADLFDAERNGMLPEERLGELDEFLTLASRCDHEFRAYDDALDFVAGRRDADRRAAKLEQLFPRGAADPKLLGLLKAPLYPYQAEGALFAVRAGRALIGDDMGLGKTIQAIAAAEILARHFGVAKVLVICPTSLKYQWQSEFVRFSGRQDETATRVINGGRAQRQKDYAVDSFCQITNYEKLQPDLDLIAAWAPDLVIVDEAQRVKNWNTIAARALRDDPTCRVFLSTDAGGTGLNLQHASTLVNMDLPWNPAVLEQRIARIHRMGQSRPVQVVNFVAKGTIEEGMLSVLAFKRSLSAGILDGGGGEISLGGSRLNRFMKDVENVTGRMGEGEAVTPAEEVGNVVTADPAMPPPDSSPDPWRALAQVGAQFVAALRSANDPNAGAHPWIERDPATGAQSLKVPLPPPEIAGQLANALSALADSLRRSN